MKILQVRFKNLNSLQGEWLVDFTHPLYPANGIFAITGPTGAGKTTILDAICLALYGRTPRLARVNKSDNEIMSRRTGECFAEVTFATVSGCFSCHWSQRRARGNPNGELQAARHEIVEADSGRILENKLSRVEAVIERVTGMNFDQFTRSMLLAQGRFAAFLLAPPDERAPILEQITGTEIYSRISMRVHERRAEERKQLESLQAELAGIQLLSAEEAERLRTEMQQQQQLAQQLAGRLETGRKESLWLEGLARFEQELAALAGQERELQERQRGFEPQRQRLERALKALALEGEYAQLTALRRQQAAEQQEQAELLQTLPEERLVLEQMRAAEQSAAAETAAARAAQQQELAVIPRVRVLDLQLAEVETQQRAAMAAFTAGEQDLGEVKARIEAGEKQQQVISTELAEIEAYLRSHALDNELVSNLTAIGIKFDQLRELAGRHQQIGAAAKAAEAFAAKNKETAEQAKNHWELCGQEWKRLEQIREQLSSAISQLLQDKTARLWREERDGLRDRQRLLERAAEVLTVLAAGQTELGQLSSRERELDNETVELRQAIDVGEKGRAAAEAEVSRLQTEVRLLSRIRDLEAERARLVAGSPCPVCGSTEHPYASGAVPQPDEAESALQHASERLREIGGRLEQGRIKLVAAEKEIEHIQNRKQQLAAAESWWQANLPDLYAAPDSEPEERLRLVEQVRPELEVKLAAVERVLQEVENCEQKLTTVASELEQARGRLGIAEQEWQPAVQQERLAAEEYGRLIRDGEQLAGQLSSLSREVQRELAPWGVTELVVSELDAVWQELTRRRDRWQQQQERKREREQSRAAIGSEIGKDQLRREQQEAQLREKRSLLEEQSRQLDAMGAERGQLYGQKQPEQEELRLKAALQAAEQVLEAKSAECRHREQAIGGLQSRLVALESSLAQRAESLRGEEQQLRERLRQAGFEDEEAYRSAMLAEAERNRLTQLAEEISREQSGLEARRRDKEAACQAEREKQLTTKSQEQLQAELERDELEYRELQQALGAIGQQLAENDKQHQRQQQRLQAIKHQEQACSRWEVLHSLIGSADGKKYRNFVQGLTFELVIAQANRQLRKMTDRYLLIHDAEQPLLLDVIDNYQAGEIRSTRNLSGGESFIVSLALALGLSQMAARNVRVDSLFLDEGFGSLDEESLETALETLAGLHQDGKLIGIISHIDAIKERISTQIQVIPQTSGRSRIAGPGCRGL